MQNNHSCLCVCPRQVKVGQLNFNLMEFSHETIPLHALQIYLLTIIISCHYTMTTYGNVSHNVHNRFFYAKGQEHRWEFSNNCRLSTNASSHKAILQPFFFSRENLYLLDDCINHSIALSLLEDIYREEEWVGNWSNKFDKIAKNLHL